MQRSYSHVGLEYVKFMGDAQRTGGLMSMTELDCYILPEKEATAPDSVVSCS
jgi:hypothetical protein